MNILVTGGAGFIGSWVAEAYISSGHDVLVIDNLSTGTPENISPNADFEKCDILDVKELERIIKSFKPEVINHHAAQINVRNSVSDPEFDARTNIIGTLNLLDLSRKYGTSKMIFASTGGAIYGEPSRIPADESTIAMPISPYGASKLCAENYLSLYKRMYDIDFVSLRYSNVYGKRQNPSGEAGVISIFCRNVIDRISCKVYGDGEQTRDYVYCEDVANANLKALDAPTGIYNIGSSEQTSIKQLIEKLKVITNRDFEIIHTAERQGDIRHISLDNNLARENLGWTPATTLDVGLRKTWEWFCGDNTEQQPD